MNRKQMLSESRRLESYLDRLKAYNNAYEKAEIGT